MRTQRSVPNFCAGFVTAKHQSTNGVLASPTDAATNYSKSFLPDEARIMRVSNFCANFLHTDQLPRNPVWALELGLFLSQSSIGPDSEVEKAESLQKGCSSR